MNTQLDKVVKQGKERAAEVAQTHVEEADLLAQVNRNAEIVGAAKALDYLAQTLNAQALRHWEGFQQAEGYKQYGCKTFVEFLEKYSPNGLTKDKYYQRKNLLDAEGDSAFDLLNSYGVPATIRKQLNAGSIEITKDAIIVGDKSASITDAKQVKALFKEVAEAFERAEDTAAKERKNLEKMMKRAGFTFDKDAEGKVKITPPDPQSPVILGRHDETDPANAAYMRVLSSLAELTRALNDLPGDEADKRLNELYRPAISSAVEMCFAFSASNAPTRAPDKLREATVGLSQADIEDLLDEP